MGEVSESGHQLAVNAAHSNQDDFNEHLRREMIALGSSQGHCLAGDGRNTHL